MTDEVPAAGDRAGWSSKKARRMIEVISVAAPLVVGLVGLLPLYIQAQRAGLALSVVLATPGDPIAGRQVGNYLREMRTSPLTPPMTVARYNAIERHVDLPSSASIWDRLIWSLPNAVFAMHDESKIEMFKSAVQTPAKECIDALLDSSHTISRPEYPSPNSIRRIGDLAVTLELIDVVGVNSREDDARSISNTTQILSACKLISGGMRNVMSEYLKRETPLKPESKEAGDLVKALTAIRANLERSDQVSGMPCAPNVPPLAHSAREKLGEIKSFLVELENKVAKIGNGVSPEAVGISHEFEKAKGLADDVEHHFDGILSTRAPTYEISSGSMLAGLVVWLIVLWGIYAKFNGLFSRIAGHSADMRTPPSRPDKASGE